jgi:hypothetical protein
MPPLYFLLPISPTHHTHRGLRYLPTPTHHTRAPISHPQLAVESLREGVMVLHMGEHRIKDDLPNISLYCGCPRGLQGRLPALRAVRTQQQYSLGVLDAPAGGVVVVFMHVVGAVSLLEWRPDLGAIALAMFRDHVSLELIKYQGYLVRAGWRAGGMGVHLIDWLVSWFRCRFVSASRRGAAA